MIVSAPQRVAHTILSTSSAIEDVTAELPMLALTFTANALPMIIGSALGVVVVGRDHRPAAGDLVAHQLGGHALARGDERHLAR